MRPKSSKVSPQGDLFRSRFENILNHNHELYRLAKPIPWDSFDQEFGPLYSEKKGRLSIPVQLLVGLSDEWKCGEHDTINIEYPDDP